MEQPKRQDTTTGNGHTKTPILASGADPTAGKSKPSHKPTSIGAGSTKPVTLTEALSLLQTLCLDLRSLNCEVMILAKDNRFYIVGAIPASIGKMTIKNGHIAINDVPVSAAQ